MVDFEDLNDEQYERENDALLETQQIEEFYNELNSAFEPIESGNERVTF